MKYTTLFITLALSFAIPAHAMEMEKFNSLFNSAPKRRIMPGLQYFADISSFFNEARDKKDTLLKLQEVIAHRRADGILNHILLDNNPLDQLKMDDTTLNTRFNDHKARYQSSLLKFLNMHENRCKKDILDIATILDTRLLGMTSQDASVQAVENCWNETYKALNISALCPAERKLLGLLVREQPVAIEEIDQVMDMLSGHIKNHTQNIDQNKK